MSEELHTNPEYPTELPYRRVLDHGFVALVEVIALYVRELCILLWLAIEL